VLSALRVVRMVVVRDLTVIILFMVERAAFGRRTPPQISITLFRMVDRMETQSGVFVALALRSRY
jgi:predicted acyltransferase